MLAVRILQKRKHLTKYTCVSNVIKREISDDPTQPPKLINNEKNKRKNSDLNTRGKEKLKKKNVIDPVSINPERQSFSSGSWKYKLHKRYEQKDTNTKSESDVFQNLVETSAENVAKEFKESAKEVKRDLLAYLKTFEVSRGKTEEDARDNLVFSFHPSLRSIFKHTEPWKIFTRSFKSQQVQLNIWDNLEKEELAYQSTVHPTNYFEEQIEWTKEGRLWHFPIDNDQGLEEEAKISFTEHIFLERYLEPWCPKKGPLRKFMQMVLIGLGKNPYLSVKDKKEHIEWFRIYFEGKKKLLQDLGAIGTTKEIEVTTQKPKSPES